MGMFLKSPDVVEMYTEIGMSKNMMLGFASI